MTRRPISLPMVTALAILIFACLGQSYVELTAQTVAKRKPHAEASDESSRATRIIAFSLREAENVARGKSRIQPPEGIGGIRSLIGFVIDDANHDMILLGTDSNTLPPLSLDDFVFLLRSARVGGLSGPGVSLEPEEGSNARGRQLVVFFGGLAGTSIGRVCFEADYLMKKMALCKTPPCVPDFRTYSDYTSALLQDGGINTWNLRSRFWFAPVYAPITESWSGDVFLLRETEVRVLVDTLSAQIDGESAPPRFKDEAAEKYAAHFSHRYGEISEKHPEFADLARFMGALKLMSLLLDRAEPETLEFWFDEYQPEAVDIPTEVPLLNDVSVHGRRKLTLVGGVRIAGLTLRLRTGETDAIRDAVILARPSPASCTWSVTLDQDWRVDASSFSEEDRLIARRFSDALTYHEREDHLQAIRCCDEVLAKYPDVLEATFLKAVCARDLAIRRGDPEGVLPALACLMQLAQAKPRLIELRYEVGSTLRTLGRYREAVIELDKVVAQQADFAPAHHALGLAWRALGNREKAARHVRTYLRLADDKGKYAAEVRRLLDEPKHETESGMRRFAVFSDKTHGINCCYPERWCLARGARIRTLLPDMPDAGGAVAAFIDRADPNHNVLIRVAPIDAAHLSEDDIADVIPALDAAYKDRFPRFAKVEAGPVRIGKVLGIRYVLKTDRAGLRVQLCVVTLVKAHKAYTVTFTAPERDYNDLWNTCFAKILSSFTALDG